MPRRPLPDAEEAARILREKRTRPARRPPPAVGQPLARMLKAWDARHSAGPHVLRARWREIAGETLGRRTEPVRVVRPRGPAGVQAGGVLEVRVDGPAAALVQHQAPELIARANLVLGAGAVSKLRIVQGPVRPVAERVAVAGPRGRRRVTPPLDAAAEAELAAPLEAAPDRLRAALVKLGRAVRRDGGS
ncbi:MAG: DUF721 domain-containing protein [Caulobacteraceae bacterium]|nr:DUF721 domain-containing protein [Caulobacter sp.]